jgi:hypothetical protein
MQFPLATASTIYKGGSACGNPATHAVIKGVSGTATFIPLGVFSEAFPMMGGAYTNSSGVNQLVEVDFLEERTILYKQNDGTITLAAQLFSPAYILDDNTFTATVGTNTKAGTIVDVSATMGVGILWDRNQ